ncbi:MAG: hypothetical protein H6810_07030 [Phycisphaeraceae bacterium]|nr:MAG: hypothetical protein H6810_07030 [Phycisphaeraceae bacterium]
MPDGRTMLEHAAGRFGASAERVVIGVLREHDERFGVVRLLRGLFEGSEIVVFDAVTSGQAETVAEMVTRAKVRGPVLVKDSDSAFVPSREYPESANAVSVCSAREVRGVRLDNKGFARLNEQGQIVATLEKQISSEWFSCGGYWFCDAEQYVREFRAHMDASDGRECYLSHVIDRMIGLGEPFVPVSCTGYEDWGTEAEWIAYRSRFGTYIIDIDGVLYENGRRHWAPRWGESAPIPEAVGAVRELSARGQCIVLMTSRPECFRDATERQLREEGVPYDKLVMGVLHGTRYVVNDYADSTPFPAAVAVNTRRNSGDWVDAVGQATGSDERGR